MDMSVSMEEPASRRQLLETDTCVNVLILTLVTFVRPRLSNPRPMLMTLLVADL
jgi:hypothetical protein